MRKTEVNDTSASTSTSDDFFHKSKAPTARFVDNKRKILDKNLSANQRDQVFLNLAKDEVQLKQKLMDRLTEATKESNKALESISQSMVVVGKSIVDGLALLATALSGVQTQQTPQGHAEYSPGPHSYPAFKFSNSFSRNLPYDHHRISFLNAQNEASRSDSPHNLHSPQE